MTRTCFITTLWYGNAFCIPGPLWVKPPVIRGLPSQRTSVLDILCDVIFLWCRSTQTVTGRSVNTLRPRQNGRHFSDDIFKCVFMNEKLWISISISLKFVPKGLINNIPALVRIVAWRRPGDKPLSEPMMVSLRTHICVTRPHWVKMSWLSCNINVMS